MRFAHLCRIQTQLFGDLVKVNFECVTRLRRAMPALGPAWRFVGEGAQTLEFVTRNIVSDRLQSSGVERARDSIAAIGPAIKKRFEMHRRDRAVFFDSGLNVHQNGMATTMTIENF